jgi:ABC-2 type transport system permease protein
MSVLSHLEYRFNFFTDTVLHPVLVAALEMAIWSAIIAASGDALFGGFTQDSYISYALWAAFFGRNAANWMYEYRMVFEIDTGTVNSLLVRPYSFYEYYMSQFFGYKLVGSMVSIAIPLSVTMMMDGTTNHSRLPLAILLQLFYLLLVHTMSFIVASLGFFLTRVHAFVEVKNIALFMLTGELFPLDLIPEPYRVWIVNLPFANAVFTPVGYLTGRLEIDAVLRGLASTFVGLLVFGSIAAVLWNSGRRRYSGTGA